MRSQASERVAPAGTKEDEPIWHIECRCQYAQPSGEEKAICGQPLLGITAEGIVPPKDRCVVCQHTEKCPFCGAPR